MTLTVDTLLIFFGVMLIAVTWIHGFNLTFQEGEIFGRPGEWMYKHLPDWVNKPLWSCPFCMASVHGTLVFIAFLWGWPWYMWVIFCFCVCGANVIISK